MKGITSSYKIFGGFGFLLLLTVAAIVGSSAKAYEQLTTLGYIKTGTLLVVVPLVILAAWFFGNQCKYIIINSEGLTFVNPVLPFLRKRRRWDYYDRCYTIHEESRSGSYEAVWLVKNNRIAVRFSSFYYRNYDEMKNGMAIPSGGTLRIHPLKQFFCLLRIAQIKKQR